MLEKSSSWSEMPKTSSVRRPNEHPVSPQAGIGDKWKPGNKVLEMKLGGDTNSGGQLEKINNLRENIQTVAQHLGGLIKIFGFLNSSQSAGALYGKDVENLLERLKIMEQTRQSLQDKIETKIGENNLDEVAKMTSNWEIFMIKIKPSLKAAEEEAVLFQQRSMENAAKFSGQVSEQMRGAEERIARIKISIADLFGRKGASQEQLFFANQIHESLNKLVLELEQASELQKDYQLFVSGLSREEAADSQKKWLMDLETHAKFDELEGKIKKQVMPFIERLPGKLKGFENTLLEIEEIRGEETDIAA